MPRGQPHLEESVFSFGIQATSDQALRQALSESHLSFSPGTRSSEQPRYSYICLCYCFFLGSCVHTAFLSGLNHVTRLWENHQNKIQASPQLLPRPSRVRACSTVQSLYPSLKCWPSFCLCSTERWLLSRPLSCTDLCS